MSSKKLPVFEQTVWDRVKKLNPSVIAYADISSLSVDSRNSLRVSQQSMYGDNVWDFSKEYPDLEPKNVLIEFSRIKLSEGLPVTDTAYRFFLDQLKEYYYTLLVNPPSTRPKWSTICASQRKGVKHLIQYMDRNSIRSFGDLTEFDFEDFLEVLATNKNENGRDVTNRTLCSRAQGLDWLYEQSGKMGSGLKVNPFGDQLSTQWARSASKVKVGRSHSTTKEMPDAVAAKLLECALKDIKLVGLVSDIRSARKTVSGRKILAETQALGARYNCSDRVPVTIRSIVPRIHSAAYIIIALFTGMRISEVRNILHGEANNWKTEKVAYEGGFKKLYFIVSKTKKLEAKPTEYQWQTIPLVKEALDALEIVSVPYLEKGNPYLFPSIKSKWPVSETTISDRLKKFAEFHDVRYKGELWVISTHQFRKKFARIMIRQGLGLKALQDQLKHYDIEMTKIYGDPNLYSLLQEEKFELSEELYEEYVGNQIPVIGGGAEDFQALRKQFLGMTKQNRKAFLKSLPGKALVEQTDDGLCFYRANKALCGGDKSNCRPADCNNSVIPADGMRRTLLWRKQENQRMMRFFHHNRPKVAFLESRNMEIDKLLTQLDQGD